MNLRELEERVIAICDRIRTRQKIEDSMIELKATFIDTKKAAGILAGQANALHGEDALWVIGVDENAGTVTGINDKTELANWLPKVESQFDGASPSLIYDRCVFDIDGALVVGLLFKTDQAPYVVKNPRRGQQDADDAHIHFWIPIRVGKSTRTAQREHVLRILTPIESSPACNVFSCDLYEELENVVGETGPDGNMQPGYPMMRRIRMKVFVAARVDARVFLPWKNSSVTVAVNGSADRVPFKIYYIAPQLGADPLTVIDRAGFVSIEARMPTRKTFVQDGAKSIDVVLTIGALDAHDVVMAPIALHNQVSGGPAQGRPTWVARL